MRRIVAAVLSAAALSVGACQKKPPESEPPSASEQPGSTGQASSSGALTDRDWVLVGLGEQTNPLGSGNEPATMRLEDSSSTAAGFAGCNRYRSKYTLKGDSLRLGPVMSTKMACADGDELERGFTGGLARIVAYEVSDSLLTLKTPDGPLLRFRPRETR